MDPQAVEGCAIAALVISVICFVGLILMWIANRRGNGGTSSKLGGGDFGDNITIGHIVDGPDAKDIQKLIDIADSDELNSYLATDLSKYSNARDVSMYYDYMLEYWPWLFIIIIYNCKREKLRQSITESFKSYFAKESTHPLYLRMLSKCLSLGPSAGWTSLSHQSYSQISHTTMKDMLESFRILNLSEPPNDQFTEFMNNYYINRKGVLVDSSGNLV